MKKRRCLIMGATGFIGTNLMRRLITYGHEVISFSTSPESPIKNVMHIQGDIRNKRLIKKLIKAKPDDIICLMGLSGQSYSNQRQYKSFELNVSSYFYLLDTVVALAPASKIIFSSSRLEYGKPHYLPVDENHPIKPLSYYGLHKHLVTDYCQFLHTKYGLHTIVLRTSNPYGPHPIQRNDYYNVINYFIDQALKDKEILIYGKGLQKRDYIYVDDVVSAIIAIPLHKKTAGKIYNIGSGKGITLIDAAREIIRQIKKGKILFVSWPKKEKEVETGDYISNITKIHQDIGWKPRYSFVQGISQTLKQLSV